jgi:regulator of sirC expression with transglutaminase-like and TPR domain
MCKRGVEFIDHLLLRCEVARELWVSIVRPFSVEWVMPGKV